MLKISNQVVIPEREIEFRAIRSRGAGGQNVNKVATGVHLRFDVRASSLSTFHKRRLLGLQDQRLSRDGIIVIKADQYRSREKNRLQALERLRALILEAIASKKPRRPTKPSRGARERRLEGKARRSRVKTLRRPVQD